MAFGPYGWTIMIFIMNNFQVSNSNNSFTIKKMKRKITYIFLGYQDFL